MFHRDTLRLIKKTYKRFLTVFLMVLIGVAFMVGLLSTGTIMRESVDKYYDEYNFMDVQLYSSYGFSENDVEAIKDYKGVQDVFATKFVDTFVQYGNSKHVTRVQEVDTDVNQFELISGRLPKNENEALTLGSTSYGTVFEEGETIQVFLENDDLSDKLEVVEYKIVGTVRSPQYMASSKEASTLENISLSAVIFVDNENFKQDVYTSIYVIFEDSQDYVSFTKDYKEFIQENIDEFKEDVVEDQQEERKDEILQEALDKIKEAEDEANSLLDEGQAEIDKGKEELDKAAQQILNGEKELNKNLQKLKDGEKEIEKNLILLEDSKKQLEDAKAMIEKETGKSYEEDVKSITIIHEVYTSLEEISKKVDENSTLLGKITSNKSEILKLETENANYELLIKALELNEEANQTKINEYKAKIAFNKIKIKSLKDENDFLENINELYQGKTFKLTMRLLDRLAGGSVKESYAGLMQITTGEKEIEAGYQQIESAKKEIEEGYVQIEKGRKQLSSSKKQVEEGYEELEKAQATLDEEREKARIEIEKAKQEIEELPTAQWMVLDRDSHYSTVMYDNNASQMEKIGQVIPLLFYLVAALVCMTTMKRLVDEERSQMGVFSALGFTKNKIISKYVLYALAASLLGSSIGVFIGVPIFVPVIYYCWKLMYDTSDIALRLPLDAALIGTLAFTVLMIVVTFFVTKAALNDSPSQLMRPKAPKNAKKIFLEKIPFIWKRLGFTSKVTARNLIRYKSRFFMTIVGVAGCTSLLVLGFGIKDSIASLIDVQFDEITKYNYTVYLDDHHATEEIIDILKDEKYNEEVVAQMQYTTKVYLEDEETIIVTIVNEDEMEDIYRLQNRQTKETFDLNDGVVITEKFAKNNGLQAGDVITIESSNGLKEEVEIVGIGEMYFQHYLFMSEEYYEDIFNETVYYDEIAVRSSDGDELKDLIEDHEHVVNVTDFEVTKSTFTNMIETLDIIVVVILLASGSLAFVVLMNLSEVNISERIREIATLKVLGFNDQEVNSYIFKEILLLTVLGALVGCPLGKIELTFVMNIIDMEMVMFGNNIEPLSYVYGFMITIVFAILVLLFMRKSLKNVQMVESLKSVE